PKFDSKLYKIEDKTVKSGKFDEDVKPTEVHIKNGEDSAAIVAEAEKEAFVVDSVTTKERKRNPTPPFITSKLQQDAARKRGFSVKRTMTTAQRLYEGIELGSEGAVGLITYMRTDSVRVSDAAIENARGFIGSSFGEAYLPAKPNLYRGKKDAQDAGSVPLRGYRGRMGGRRRPDHLYAYRFGPRIGCSDRKCTRIYRIQFRRSISAGEAESLSREKRCAGRSRGDPPDGR